MALGLEGRPDPAQGGTGGVEFAGPGDTVHLEATNDAEERTRTYCEHLGGLDALL